MSKREATTHAVEILRRRYVGEEPERLASVEDERLHARVARRVYELRVQAGLTQSELAEKVGTTRSEIGRMESADYEGHSLSMLGRIADALDARLEVALVRVDPV